MAVANPLIQTVNDGRVRLTLGIAGHQPPRSFTKSQHNEEATHPAASTLRNRNRITNKYASSLIHGSSLNIAGTSIVNSRMDQLPKSYILPSRFGFNI
ncbi:hypothetical protein GALMADRAFT_260175, partial [Galerina marginata CBS 339.88]